MFVFKAADGPVVRPPVAAGSQAGAAAADSPVCHRRSCLQPFECRLGAAAAEVGTAAAEVGTAF